MYTSTENLTIREPSDEQMKKFEEINSLTETKWEDKCHHFDDCSICPMAVHTFLFSTVRHKCVYGISKSEFLAEMSSADTDF